MDGGPCHGGRAEGLPELMETHHEHCPAEDVEVGGCVGAFREVIRVQIMKRHNTPQGTVGFLQQQQQC